MRAFLRQALRGVSLGLALLGMAHAQGTAGACTGTLYLTLDTGSMRHAELIADILRRHQVKATFFVANEKTPRGDHALDDSWRGYWQARVAEGHQFGSHTFDHVYFKPAAKGQDLFVAQPQFGAQAGRALQWNQSALCGELDRVQQRFEALTGRRLAPIWRAPGGRAPAATLQAARACGYRHVYWSPAGFLGDELSSEQHPNAVLLERALERLKDGDILMAHLGIWSRRDPFAPMFEPLIRGLKARGFCFATIDPQALPAAAGP